MLLNNRSATPEELADLLYDFIKKVQTGDVVMTAAVHMGSLYLAVGSHLTICFLTRGKLPESWQMDSVNFTGNSVESPTQDNPASCINAAVNAFNEGKKAQLLILPVPGTVREDLILIVTAWEEKNGITHASHIVHLEEIRWTYLFRSNESRIELD